jgi:hypothetical protein
MNWSNCLFCCCAVHLGVIGIQNPNDPSIVFCCICMQVGTSRVTSLFYVLTPHEFQVNAGILMLLFLLPTTISILQSAAARVNRIGCSHQSVVGLLQSESCIGLADTAHCLKEQERGALVEPHPLSLSAHAMQTATTPGGGGRS